MTQEIWFRNDIGNVLLGINQASASAGGTDEFRAGFRAALHATAVVFGLANEVADSFGDKGPRVIQTPVPLRRMIGPGGMAVLVPDPISRDNH